MCIRDRYETFDLLVIDWHAASGKDLIKWVRNGPTPSIPILLLAHPREEEDALGSLACSGVDDFMRLPVRAGELAARVQALLRRTYMSPAAVYTWGDYVFKPKLHAVSINGERVHLTQKEFELALLFFRNMGRLMSRKYLMESVWTLTHPPEVELLSRSLDTHVSRIRCVLNLRPSNGYRLVAVYGQGYRLESLADEMQAA